MSASFHYGIRKRKGSDVTVTRLPTTEAVARRVYAGVLRLAEQKGYVVVELECDHHVAVKQGCVDRMEFKFVRLAHDPEPVYMSVSPALVAFGVASVRLQGAE